MSLTLSDFIEAVSRSGETTFDVSVNRVKHGNPGQAGDYSVVTITMGDQVARFTQTAAGWESDGFVRGNG